MSSSDINLWKNPVLCHRDAFTEGEARAPEALTASASPRTSFIKHFNAKSNMF